MKFYNRSMRAASFLVLGLVAGCASSGTDIETQTSSTTTEAPTPHHRQEPLPTPPSEQRVARTTDRSALNADEVRATLAGNSVYVGGQGSEFAAVHNADGSMTGRIWGGGNEQSGGGAWRVDDNGQYCRKWDNAWSQGQWGCFEVYRDGDQLQLERVSGSGANGAMELQTGNPHDL